MINSQTHAMIIKINLVKRMINGYEGMNFNPKFGQKIVKLLFFNDSIRILINLF